MNNFFIICLIIFINICFIKTANGQSWELVNSNTNHDLWMVHWINDSSAIAVGDSGIILRTTDQGYSWTPQRPKRISDLRDLAFFDQDTGIIVGWGELYRTTNAGLSWDFIEWTDNIDYLQGNLSSCSLLNNKIGLFVEEYEKSDRSKQSILFYTNNSGVSWQEKPITLQGAISTAILNDSVFIIVGGWGAVYRTNDTGRSWSKRHENSTRRLEQVKFYDKFGIAVGTDGVILKSTDMGINWSHCNNTPYLNWFTSVSIIDTNHFYVAGSEGLILETTDGGMNWRKMSVANYRWLYGIALNKHGHGIAVGRNGTIVVLNPQKTNINDQEINNFNINIYNNYNSINLIIESIKNLDILFQLFNQEGVCVITSEKTIYSGVNNFDLDIQDIPSGMYYCRISSTSKQQILPYNKPIHIIK